MKLVFRQSFGNRQSISKKSVCLIEKSIGRHFAKSTNRKTIDPELQRDEEMKLFYFVSWKLEKKQTNKKRSESSRTDVEPRVFPPRSRPNGGRGKESRNTTKSSYAL